MKPYEETWALGGTYHLDGRRTHTICVIDGVDGLGVLDTCKDYDGNNKARAKLAAQAPAMARALLGHVSEECSCLACNTSRAILRDAGVLP